MRNQELDENLFIYLDGNINLFADPPIFAVTSASASFLPVELGKVASLRILFSNVRSHRTTGIPHSMHAMILTHSLMSIVCNERDVRNVAVRSRSSIERTYLKDMLYDKLAYVWSEDDVWHL